MDVRVSFPDPGLIQVEGEVFGVNIIPHTAAVTTFGTLQPGSRVNIEIDTLARYVARLQETAG